MLPGHRLMPRFVLTFTGYGGIVFCNGEMSERFKELVLKTSDGATHRGFESHSLRQKRTPVLTGVLFCCVFVERGFKEKTVAQGVMS